MLNQKEFDYLGITKFHEAGYKGQGVIICSKEEILEDVFDDVFSFEFEKEKDKYSEHATEVMDFIHQVAPDATKWAIETNGMVTKNKGKYLLEKSEKIEYLRNNPPDVLTTSFFRSTDFYDYVMSLYKELYNKDCFMCLAAGNENTEIMKLATIDTETGEDLWKAIGACNYFPSRDEAKRQFSYAKGEELDYMSFHGLTCKWNNEELDGTSFSCPVLAAMVVLIQCFFKEKTGKKLNNKNLNKFIIDHCEDLDSKGKDIKSGYGILRLPDPDSIDIAKYTSEPIVEKPTVAAPVEKEEGIILTIGSPKAIVNGEEIILDVAPIIMNNRTLVPIRFISETLGYEVGWDEATQQVTIKMNKEG